MIATRTSRLAYCSPQMRRFQEAALRFAHGFIQRAYPLEPGDHNFKDPVRIRTPNDAYLLAMLSPIEGARAPPRG